MNLGWIMLVSYVRKSQEVHMTYPVSFRRKVLKTKEEEGLSFSGVAKKFNISKAAIFRWSQQIEPKKQRNRKWYKW